MADAQFYRTVGPFSLSQLAEIGGAELADGGEANRKFTGVAALSTAGATDVSFLDNKRYRPDLEASQAGACILDPTEAQHAPDGTALLLSKTPYRAYARIAQAFYPEAVARGEIHEQAFVDPSAEVGRDSDIAAGAVIGARARIGERCRIGANTSVGEGVEIGDDCRIGANVSLSYCLIGARVVVHAGAVVGSRGFGFDMSDFPYIDVPQLGRVVIEEDVEIGANTTIDRGAGPDTVIGAGSKLDNLVQIGHNVRLGRGCVLVGQAGIAGSAVLEDFVVVAAQSGVAGHLTIGRGAQIGAKSGAMRDVPAGARVLGAPAMPAKEFFRLVGIWQRLLKTKGKLDE